MREPAATGAAQERDGVLIQYDQGVYSVTYRKSGRGRRLRHAALLLMAILVALALLNGASLLWLALLLAFLLATAVSSLLIPSTGTFHFTRYLFSVGGRRYNRQWIGTLYLQLPKGEPVLLPITGGGGPFGAPAGDAFNRRHRQPAGEAERWERLSRVWGWRQGSVGFLLDGRRVPLAMGLSAEGAEALFRRVGELVGEG